MTKPRKLKLGSRLQLPFIRGEARMSNTEGMTKHE